jgi:hypothetical protein
VNKNAVALTFIALCGKLSAEEFRAGREINHRNGNKSNNRLNNLQLVTRSENMVHCHQFLAPSLNRSRGTAHHSARLTPDDVAKILELRRAGKSGYAIAKIYKVSPTAIYLIFNGTNWKHITQPKGEAGKPAG